MQSTGKKGLVVIASVLKPVDDTRMLEKMGASLAQSGYPVIIIGQVTISIPVYPNISFIPLKRVNRVSIDRLLLPIKIALNTYQLKPEYLIANTHELLIVSLVNRIFFGTKILYDIRENYYRNIRFAETYPPVLRVVLALIVRLKEKLTSPFIHHYFLAEKAYRHELGFLGKRFTILENKALLPPGFVRTADPKALQLIFTGTIARSTGVFDAIALAEKLHTLDPMVRLTIVGYCALAQVRSALLKEIENKPFIRLIGIHQPVPHPDIIEQIAQANFGIIYYPPSPHTEGAMPTKLYEYLAAQLPILTWPRQRFSDLVLQHQAGLCVGVNFDQLLQEMRSATFYPKAIPNVSWESEKLISVMEGLKARSS